MMLSIKSYLLGAALGLSCLMIGCSAFSKAEEFLTEAKQTIQRTNETIASLIADYKAIRAELSAAKEAADTNKDGKTSGEEWLKWALGGGGVTLLATIGLILRRLTGEVNELYDITRVTPVAPAPPARTP